MAPYVPVPFLLLYVHPRPTPFPGLVPLRLQSIPKNKGTNIGDDHKEILPNEGHLGPWSPFPRGWVSWAGTGEVLGSSGLPGAVGSIKHGISELGLGGHQNRVPIRSALCQALAMQLWASLTLSKPVSSSIEWGSKNPIK